MDIRYLQYHVRALLAHHCTFANENFYNRKTPTSGQPPRDSRLMRLIDISQWKSRSQRSTFSQALARPYLIISRLPVLIAFISYVFSFAWVIGSIPLYPFFSDQFITLHRSRSVGDSIFLAFVCALHGSHSFLSFFYFTPVIALILSDVSGHWSHTYIAGIHTRLHSGHFHPEARLVTVWLAMPLQITGLVVLGYALQHE
jgi:hypothetical protein